MAAAPLVQRDVPDTYRDFIRRSITLYKNETNQLNSFFDLNKWESSVPQQLTLEDKRKLFQFAYSEQYPPHLSVIPTEDDKSLLQILDFRALFGTTILFLPIIPGFIRDLAPDELQDKTIQALVERNRRLHEGGHNMYLDGNIGDRDDWYTDAVFSQQQFTGSNPTTITLADSHWIRDFTQVAKTRDRHDLLALISSAAETNSLFVQDYSYFRDAVHLLPDAELGSQGRYGCASVALFHLEAEGKLHPLAITLDYKGSMDASVTILNSRITSKDSSADEANDWPWRYAKTCMQVCDWHCHEIIVHLVNTHLVEEAIIVAAHRIFDSQHIVFLLLEPHWASTLSLNAAARKTLVPRVIAQLAAFSPDQTYAFLKTAYDKFNWTQLYVPEDLRRRGFPIEDLDKPKYHNYGYARNIAHVWNILRKFVGTVLRSEYKGGDLQVAGDPYVSAFCAEMRSSTGAQMASFPAKIETLDELIDMVTMCIHIASPQHTAINYLQQYYQTFVPNKPSALYTPLPQSFEELKRYTEVDLFKALPVDHPRDWLMMAQVPYLLSFRVAGDQNILTFAEEASWRFFGHNTILKAASVLKNDLENFVHLVEQYSKDLDDQKTPYTVLDPRLTASSILI